MGKLPQPLNGTEIRKRLDGPALGLSPVRIRMKPAQSFSRAFAVAALASSITVCVYADESQNGSAPTPVPARAGIQEEPATVQPLVRDSDDAFDGTWDLETSWRHPLNGDYVGLYRALTTINVMGTSRSWAGIEVGGGLLELRRGTWASQVARDPIELEAALTYRYFFNEPGHFVRPYFRAELGWFVFIWDYREPLVIEDDVAHMDYVWGIDPSVALGVNLELNKRLNAFGEAEVGGMVMPQDTTYHHVYNDFFDSFGYFGLRAGLRLKF